MQNSTPFIDIHIHPNIKPYGMSKYENALPLSISNAACVWFQDKNSTVGDGLENIIGVARYRQSDLTTLTNAQCEIACVSLYPIEQGFFNTRNNYPQFVEKFLGQLASMMGKKRITEVMSPSFNYFEDLNSEYEFLLKLNKKPALGSSKIYELLSPNELGDNSNIKLIITIEGSHCFCNGNNTFLESNWIGLQDRIQKVKKWEHPPFFITLAHHFYNGICTHAKSLYDKPGKLLNQEIGMRNSDWNPIDNLPAISELGYELIDSLLSTQNGNRILVDVKHMSREARIAYYNYIESNYEPNSIPIIWSHGAVDFDNQEINIDLELDVMQIYHSKGIIGIEIDQRILGYNTNRLAKWFKGIFKKRKTIEYEQASYFWKQILTIAEFVYSKDPTLNPWECIALGSDYDGVINPLNAYRDAGKIPILYNQLITYLEDYWAQSNTIIPKPNHKQADDIIYEIMYSNAKNFISTFFLKAKINL